MPVVQAKLEPVDDEFIDKLTDMMMNVKKKPGVGKKKKKAAGTNPVSKQVTPI